jgi:uncharacterized NAD(P)/FAD-binding protein YdhS
VTDHQIAIAGGGASGVLLARALLELGANVTLFEPRSELGLGVAYATHCPLHLLNAPAGRMSALAERPGHFLEWLAAHGEASAPADFLPRSTYGRYLGSLVAEMRATARGRLRVIPAFAVDARIGASDVRTRDSDGGEFTADALVLAIGNAKPSLWPHVAPEVRGSARFFDSAWSDEAITPADPNETVVLLGTGLTAVDAVLGLRYNGHRGHIVMVSRRGLLPHEHRLFDRPPAAAPQAETLGDVIAALRGSASVDDDDWRLTLDALRSEVNARWEAMDLDEQRRFVRHVLPYWNVHRHRMAPAVARTIAGLIADGTLEMLAGRTGEFQPTDDAVRVPITLRGSGDVRMLDAQRVINCSGPEHDVTKRKNPLIRSLLAAGVIAPHPLRIGMRVAPDGALLDSHGRVSDRLFALGPVRYGTLIETTAIPEIREQVRALAERLTTRVRAPAAHRA